MPYHEGEVKENPAEEPYVSARRITCVDMKSSLAWVAWNAFLALIPVGLAQVILRAGCRDDRRTVSKAALWMICAAWLVFLPNTCYLLTEWRHFLLTLDQSDLYLRSRMDSWMTLRLMAYTAFYFGYSAFGMLTFALAIRPVARVVREMGARIWVCAIPLFGMLSLGVYLGLIQRYNSWDLLTRPGAVWSATAEVVHHPLLTMFIVGFAGFLWLAYTAIDIWVDGFLGRWNRRSQWHSAGAVRQPAKGD